MLLNFLKPQTSNKALAAAVEAALVETLYASRLSLIIGAALGIALSIIIYISCHSSVVLGFGTALSACGILRIVSFQFYSPGVTHARFWKQIYEYGALSYAALLGALTAVTILISHDVKLQLVAGVMATGYAAGAASRNTGRPAVAISQFLLAQTPWTVALLAEPSAAHGLLFVSNILFFGVITDITLLMYRTVLNALVDKQEKLQLAEIYERLSKTDSLTGLGNRSSLDIILGARLAERLGPIVVAWLDLDNFKMVNDSLGHATGDNLLRSVAVSISQAAGDRAHVSRFGGDEFVIVASVRDDEEACSLGQALVEAVRSNLNPDQALPSMTASVGLALSQSETSADTLLRHADVALYEAKADGRDRAKLFQPTMERELIRRKMLEGDLKRALEDDQLELHFQPIIDLQTGRVASFEALVRWTHLELGPVPAMTIISTAEAANVIDHLTVWVLRRACATAAQWPENITVAVNMPAMLVHCGGLAEKIAQILALTDLDARRLDIELTESALLEDSQQAADTLTAIQEMGVRLSLDDFGTGYSSLSYLCRYDFDMIKIDRSFTHGAEHRAEARAVIKAITSLARSMQLGVVAEGIETATQACYAMEQGCRFGQGYLFSRAVPFPDTIDLIDTDFFVGMQLNRAQRALKLVS